MLQSLKKKSHYQGRGMFLSSRQSLGKHVLHINHSCAGQQDYLGDLFYLCAPPQFQYFLKDMLLNLDSFTYFSETGSHEADLTVTMHYSCHDTFFFCSPTYLQFISLQIFTKRSYHLTCKIQMKSIHQFQEYQEEVCNQRFAM